MKKITITIGSTFDTIDGTCKVTGWNGHILDCERTRVDFAEDEDGNLDYDNEVETVEEERLTLEEAADLMKDADNHGENYSVSFEEAEPRTVQIRKISGLSRAAFSRRYNIPLRTLEAWDAEDREAPEYVLDLLERAVREDFRETKKNLIIDRHEDGSVFMTFEEVKDWFGILDADDMDELTEAVLDQNDRMSTGHSVWDYETDKTWEM